MGILFGDSEVSEIYYGRHRISEIYFQSDLVWADVPFSDYTILKGIRRYDNYVWFITKEKGRSLLTQSNNGQHAVTFLEDMYADKAVWSVCDEKVIPAGTMLKAHCRIMPRKEEKVIFYPIRGNEISSHVVFSKIQQGPRFYAWMYREGNKLIASEYSSIITVKHDVKADVEVKAKTESGSQVETFPKGKIIPKGSIIDAHDNNISKLILKKA